MTVPARDSRSVWRKIWQRPSMSDLSAVHAGQTRVVTCHIRSDIEGLPHKFVYGKLLISPQSLRWQRYLSRRDIRTVPLLSGVLEVRNVSGISEWNIKRGLFKIVVARGPSGTVELAVPSGDVTFLRSMIDEMSGS
jgi:hypothetical protein